MSAVAGTERASGETSCRTPVHSSHRRLQTRVMRDEVGNGARDVRACSHGARLLRIVALCDGGVWRQRCNG